ncbi:unnamed protein product [Bursaphelenchus xylophilus]|uniref:(pine wood nematode) hypothetical protein n=1 Tax=Bursaphelenchus xylophilus TaxID=6326 RepID=A0A1I7RZE5_BURXY|nr:unnamed protein product [Bursaphelenchus xylophilus]CAG9106516.1 unnamed protein product [Bursaphelenchus xylophilus]
MTTKRTVLVAFTVFSMISQVISQESQPSLPLMGPSSAAFPLRNSYVPQAVSFASPAYVFASYSSGGYRLQGQVEDDSDDKEDEKRRKFMVYRRFH